MNVKEEWVLRDKIWQFAIHWQKLSKCQSLRVLKREFLYNLLYIYQVKICTNTSFNFSSSVPYRWQTDHNLSSNTAPCISCSQFLFARRVPNWLFYSTVLNTIITRHIYIRYKLDSFTPIMPIIRYRPSTIKLLIVVYIYGTLENEPTCSELVGSIKIGDNCRRCRISQKVTIDKHYFPTNCLTDLHLMLTVSCFFRKVIELDINATKIRYF